jgi:4-aminobutyrate aminotransferase
VSAPVARPLTRARVVLDRDRQAVADCMKIRFYPFVPARAEGVRITDSDGNSYLDFVAAGGVMQTGYRHPAVDAAIRAELDASWSTPHCCYPSERTVELAERLCALLPGGFATKAWFGTTGSDANDCLVKLLPEATGRPRLISFIGAYHGQTLGSAGLSGHSAQARLIGAGNVTKVPYPNPYRPIDPSSPASVTRQCIDFLERHVLASVSPARDTAAIVVEPVQSDGGDIVPPADFFPELRALCDRHGIWLVFDEVKTGLGRTGAMFGFEHAGVTADAIALGKPLGGGLPLSAVVGRAELLDREKLAENAAQRGAQLLTGLRELQDRHPLIGDVRGQGLICGAELVTDRATREPAATDAARLVYRCFELGLLVIYTGLTSNVIELTPPLTIATADVEEMLAIFDHALTDIEEGRFDDEKLAGYAGW